MLTLLLKNEKILFGLSYAYYQQKSIKRILGNS